MWHVRVSVHQLPDCKGSFLFFSLLSRSLPNFLSAPFSHLSRSLHIAALLSIYQLPQYEKWWRCTAPSSRFLMKILSNSFSQFPTPRVSTNTQVPVGLCTIEHPIPSPAIQTPFHKLYHPLVQSLFPTFDCKFTMGDCSKSLTKLTNTHCSSLVTSSQKVISYSAICSTGISVVLFLILWRENSANRSHKNQSTWISIWRQSWITLQCQKSTNSISFCLLIKYIKCIQPL